MIANLHNNNLSCKRKTGSKVLSELIMSKAQVLLVNITDWV